MVDRLLASPRYGERWGRYWLDIARFADTKGYVRLNENPNYGCAWTYRDYVIRAFNEDLPYDQFILQQLAADQLALGEDRRPLAAMGFLTLGERFINSQHDIIDDRIDVVTRGLLGLTVTCIAATTTSSTRFRRATITPCTASSPARSSRRCRR